MWGLSYPGKTTNRTTAARHSEQTSSPTKQQGMRVRGELQLAAVRLRLGTMLTQAPVTPLQRATQTDPLGRGKEGNVEDVSKFTQ